MQLLLGHLSWLDKQLAVCQCAEFLSCLLPFCITPPPTLSHNHLQDAKPAGRHEPLINGKMFKHIVAQGFYQMFWMFLFLYGLPKMMPQYHVASDEDFLRLASVLFNTFIWAQVFNLINARRINDEYNIFEGEAGDVVGRVGGGAGGEVRLTRASLGYP